VVMFTPVDTFCLSSLTVALRVYRPMIWFLKLSQKSVTMFQSRCFLSSSRTGSLGPKFFIFSLQSFALTLISLIIFGRKLLICL